MLTRQFSRSKDVMEWIYKSLDIMVLKITITSRSAKAGGLKEAIKWLGSMRLSNMSIEFDDKQSD